MKIGLIDVDGKNFPNLPLMKLSAWYKKQGHHVEWYQPLISGRMDKVYMSKIFSFTPDYMYFPDAKEVIKGGTGYCIKNVDGKEIFDRSNNHNMPSEIEHTYPDYSLYPQYANTACGFLTRGCPRNCEFCHVGDKEGCKSYKVADLREFWDGQKDINLLDPNLLACTDHMDLLGQLAESAAYVDFSQGIDARLLTAKNIEMIRKLRIKQIHFAWDTFSDGKLILPKLKMFKELTYWDQRKMTVYILANFMSSHDEDLERVYKIRDLGYTPYVMLYDKQSLSSGHVSRRLQRWVNNKRIFRTVFNFNDYKD